MSAESRAVFENALNPASGDGAADPATPTPSPTPTPTPAEPPSPRGTGGDPAPASTATPQADPAATPVPAGKNTTLNAPAHKHTQILQNARDKEREHWEKQLGISFADAHRVEAAKAFLASGLALPEKEALEHFNAFTQDPAGYLSRFAHHYGYRAVVAGDPAHAAPAAPAAPAAAPRPAFVKPEPRFRDSEGGAVYSDGQVDGIIEHLQAELAATVAGLTQRLDSYEEFAGRMRAAEANSVAWGKAEERLRELESRPGFTPEVQAEMARLIRADKNLDPEVAFARAQSTHYVPSLERQTRQRVIDELGSQPVAPVHVAPSTVATRTSESGKSKRGGMSSRDAIAHAMNVHNVERL